MAFIKNQSDAQVVGVLKSVGAAHAFSANHLNEIMERSGEAIQKEGETREAAVVRFCNTPDGRIIRKAYYEAFRRERGTSAIGKAAPNTARYDHSRTSPAWRAIEMLADEFVLEAEAAGRVIKRADALSQALRTPRGQVLKKRLHEETVELAKRMKL